MRLTEHQHMLVQVLGFQHPREFFKNGVFKDLFRRVWSYFASISFVSQEAFARHCAVPEAMVALQREPLVPITPKQRAKLGDERAQASLEAQASARGLSNLDDAVRKHDQRWLKWTPSFYADTSLTAEEWSTRACVDSNTGGIKCLNHVCLPKTCVRGVYGFVVQCSLQTL